MNKINYSIIIPHKNIPDLLQRCLDSIPHREDLEIIVVDDNSDPEVVDFDHFPGVDRDDTQVVFDKAGRGAGHARNVALGHARGKWLVFADADDYFTPFFPEALDIYKDSAYELIFFKAKGVYSDTGLPSGRSNKGTTFINEYLQAGVNCSKAELNVRLGFSEPWAKFVKRTLVERVKAVFDETPVCNDVRFSYTTGYNATPIHIDSRDIYCYVTKRMGSLSSKEDPQAQLARLSVTLDWIKFVRERGLPFRVPYVDNLLLTLAVDYSHNKEVYRQKRDLMSSKGYSNWHILLIMFKAQFIRLLDHFNLKYQ